MALLNVNLFHLRATSEITAVFMQHVRQITGSFLIYKFLMNCYRYIVYILFTLEHRLMSVFVTMDTLEMDLSVLWSVIATIFLNFAIPELNAHRH